MNKTLKIVLIVLLVIFLLVIGAVAVGGWYLYNSFTQVGGALPEVNAFLRDVEGDVTYTRDGGSFVATNYMALEEADVIRTGDDSSAAIYWSGYGRTLLEENTEVEISKAERPEQEGIRARLQLEAGRTWTRIEKLLGVGSDVTVQSSDVVATVRGTSFGVDHVGEAVQVRVAESEVAVGTGTGDLGGDDFSFSEAVNVQQGRKVLHQEDAFGEPEMLSQNDLQDQLLVEGNEPIPLEDLTGCSELGAFEFWNWFIRSIQYIQTNPGVLDTAAGQESFIEWLPNRYRLCARTILNS